MSNTDKSKKRSTKHHYLPRHYLRGFTNETGLFFVYDKCRDKILDKPTTPDAFFFENNLNTVTFPSGESSDFLEDLYTENENRAWDSLDKIRESSPKDSIEPLERMNLFLFLLTLHWRLPSNFQYVEELSKKFFLGDEKLSCFNLKSRNESEAPKGVIDKIKYLESFKKTSRLMLPFTPFYEKEWFDKLKDWRFLYTEDNENWYLVGDNPFVTKGVKDHDPIHCLDEFVFPVSGSVLLVAGKRPICKGVSSYFKNQLNIAIIKRSKRFIACPRKEYLEAIVSYYRLYADKNKEENIVYELFKMLEDCKS